MSRRSLRSCVQCEDLRLEFAGIPASTPQRSSWLAAALLAAVALFVSPAQAGIAVRVEAAPVSDPIQVFVTVTDGSGAPIGGLDASAFTVSVDGVVIPQANTTFTLPPTQDPSQKVSVIFAMDYSESVTSIARDVMEDSVVTFINSMNPGDFAAIIKFNDTNPLKASLVIPFTEIDGPSGAGTSALISAVMSPYPGNGTNLLDAINLGIDHFVASSSLLPAGPKAVVVITDGNENASVITKEGVVEDNASANSIPIFLIGVGTINRLELMNRLAAQSGGEVLVAPTSPEIAAAYVTISELLNNEYLVSVPSSITDCDQHTLGVSVTGQTSPTSATFQRCGAVVVPPPPPPPIPSPSGGGGGGAVTVPELLIGLIALLAGRRRRV